MSIEADGMQGNITTMYIREVLLLLVYFNGRTFRY